MAENVDKQTGGKEKQTGNSPEMQRVQAELEAIKAQLAAVVGELATLKTAKSSPEKTTTATVDRTNIVGDGTPPEDHRSLNADWLGARQLPDGYDNVPWKPGQRWAATKSVAGKAFMPIAVGGAMAGLGASVGSIPVIGKIPFLASAAGGLQSAILSVTGPLGLGTGINATNAFMASLPTGLGTAAAGALAIPTGLAGIGYLKGLVLGRRYGGYWNNVKAGAMMPFQAPVVAYRSLMSARERSWRFIEYATDKTLGRAYRFTKKQVNDYVIPAIQPNTPSVTGSLVGLSLALMNGTPVGPAMLAGYFGVKAARKIFQKLSGSGAAPAKTSA